MPHLLSFAFVSFLHQGTSAANIHDLTSLSSPSIVIALVMGILFCIALIVATRVYYQRALAELEASEDYVDLPGGGA